MKTFKQFPAGTSCKICQSSKEGDIVLIPITGTQDGHNAQAEQFHLECIIDKLCYDRDIDILYGVLDGVKPK